jgi:outer membrane phospholipase A
MHFMPPGEPTMPIPLFPPLLLALFLLLLASFAHAADWLIAPHSETVRAGESLAVVAVRPEGTSWPERLRLRLAGEAAAAEIDLLPAEAAGESPRRRYQGRLPETLAGLVRAELVGQPSNRLALLVAAADPLHRMGRPAPTAAEEAGSATPAPPPEEPALSANEPVYFVAGTRGGANARFQLSFKYRLFDPAGAPVHTLPFLDGLHFGYTQSSVWDLGADSKPFRDTSYRPTFFWQRFLAGDGVAPRYLRFGYEHESNGKDGANSRSIDTLFVLPAWRQQFAGGAALTFAPKLYAYLDREDNPDIGRYRGHIDWNLRYGHEADWLLSAQIRRGNAGHASGQFDLSYPLREPIFARTGGFLHFQLFTGYGESLLDYNQKRNSQLRIGFSIVR